MKASILLAMFFSIVFAAKAQVTTQVDSSAAAVTTVQQEPEKAKKKFDPRRLVFGGSLGASFGDYTFINISPQVGYMFSNTFTAGAGVNYVNSSNKTRYNNMEVKESYSYAGLNLYARVFPTNFLFASIQPEMNYSWGSIKFENSNQPDIKQDTEWIPTLLVGAGLILGRQGGRGGVMLSIQYDLAQNPRSPYGTAPFMGVGFSF